MACCKVCCGCKECAEGEEGKCCCGNECCTTGTYCCNAECVSACSEGQAGDCKCTDACCTNSEYCCGGECVVACGEGGQGPCKCGSSCCDTGEYCCSGACQAEPCDPECESDEDCCMLSLQPDTGTHGLVTSVPGGYSMYEQSPGLYIIWKTAPCDSESETVSVQHESGAQSYEAGVSSSYCCDGACAPEACPP